jgi:hypothetical protein
MRAPFPQKISCRGKIGTFGMILPFKFTRNRTPAVFQTANQLLSHRRIPESVWRPENGPQRIFVLWD